MKTLKTYENFENKIYPFQKIKDILIWFEKKHNKEINKDGWLISHIYSYNTENWGKTPIFQIQKIDEPNDDQKSLKSDEDAAKLASRWGFIFDNENIIYDFNNTIYNNRKNFEHAFDLNLL